MTSRPSLAGCIADDGRAGGSALAGGFVVEGGVGLEVLVKDSKGNVVAEIRHKAKGSTVRDAVENGLEEVAKAIKKIVPILRRKTGHDFSRYKESTLVRRIQRRMQVLYFDSVSKYVECLQHDLKEVDNLFKDLLIGVTVVLAGFHVPLLFDNMLMLIGSTTAGASIFSYWTRR